jgi:hypothetical protein
MAFSSFCTIQNFAGHLTVPAILNLRYFQQTRTKNPSHQSVACAGTYFRMSIQMGKEGSCKNRKQLILAPVFGFHFVMYEFENKIAS